MNATSPISPSLVITGILLLAGPAFAQFAEGLDTPDPVPAPAAAAAAKPAPAPAAETAEVLPSRYAGSELKAYVGQLSARLSIRSRATDPFGRYQDPDYVAPEPKIMTKSPTQRFKAEPPMPFADVISGITINGVLPAKQQFLIGDRKFGLNDVFALRLPNGKQINVRVLAVSATKIRFRHQVTNEIADLTLNLLPAGMKKGTGNISAPGVESTDSNAPIDIQPSTFLSTI